LFFNIQNYTGRSLRPFVFILATQIKAMKKFFSSINWRDHFINFLVVIVGVTIAFYLSNRKERTEQAQLERNSLESIVVDLNNDIEFLTASTDTLQTLKSKLQHFVGDLMAGQATRDSLFEYISIQYVQLPFFPSDNTYQSLVVSGKLDVISDFELRKQLTELYHRHYQTIKLVDELSSQQKNQLILPYLMTLNHGRPQSINIYEPSFVNTNMYSLYYLTQKLTLDSVALESAINLRASINIKLKEL